MYGFNRLIEAVDKIAERMDEEIIMQIGESTCTPKNAKYFRYTSSDEIEHLYKASRIVICHAGVGSILTALKFNKLIIIVPRRKIFGEHIDDHQIEIANKLKGTCGIKVVYDLETLEDAIEKSNDICSVQIDENHGELVIKLKAYIRNLDSDSNG